MATGERDLFLKIALALRMIDLGQFNEARESLLGDEPDEGGKLLLDKGYITQDQYCEVASMIEEAKRQEGAGLETYSDDAPPAAVDESYGDRFDLLKTIGQGGAGRVFLAFDKSIGRDVAIKEVLPSKLERERDYHLTRFIREAKLSGRLQHPGVVPVYELTKKADGTYFYAMKFVQGRTLFHAIMEASSGESPQESFKQRLSLLDRLIDAAEAMGYAHSKGIIHRDLKPSNIVLGEFGETVILDWGLARRLDERDEDAPHNPDLTIDETTEGLTRHGAQLGTPSYMAPEQIDPSFGDVDVRTDVYTLGVILFMILTGTKPFPGRGEAVMQKILESEGPPSPRNVYEFVPPELAAICMKAMARRKEDRFGDASELAEELKAYRDGRLVSVYAYSRRELFRRFVSRNKAAVVISALLIISIIAGSAVTSNYAIEAHRAKRKALDALEEVTKLSEASMMLVRSSAVAVDRYFDELERALIETTKQISATAFDSHAAIKADLEKLAKAHPEADAFMLVDMSGNTITAYPSPVKVPKDIMEWELSYIKGEIDPDEKGDMSGIFALPSGRKGFVFTAPVMKGSRTEAGLMTVMEIEKAVPVFLDFDPRQSPYQIWLMRDDGTIVYDEDANQIGRNLFSDEMYRDFPELLKFGDMIKKQPWGIGHYSFLGPKGKETVYKVAAWDTLRSDGTEWKLVATHPYSGE